MSSTYGIGKQKHTICREHKRDCFAYGVYGTCNALCDTDFPGECPFYKPDLVRDQEHQQSIAKLMEKGREDLVLAYEMRGRNGRQI